MTQVDLVAVCNRKLTKATVLMRLLPSTSASPVLSACAPFSESTRTAPTEPPAAARQAVRVPADVAASYPASRPSS